MPDRRGRLSPAGLARALGVTLVALAGLVLLAGIATSTQPPTVYSKDLLQDYVAARAVVDGVDPYLTTATLSARYTPAAPGPPRYPTPHPPTAILLFVPFVWFDYPTTVRIWLGLELICLGMSLSLLARDVGPRPRILVILVGCAALMLWYPVFEDVGVGQLMIPLLLCLAAARLAFARKRPELGGGLVGLALLIKPVPWPLLLVLVWRREWRALGVAVATIAVGYGVAISAIGFDRVLTYLTRVLPLVSGGFHALSRNLSLWTVGWRLFAGTTSLAFGWIYPGTIDSPPLVESPTAAVVVSFLLPSLALLAAVALARRQASLEWAFGIMVCASILASPTFWNCYLVLLALPISSMLVWLRARSYPRQAVMLLVVTLAPTLAPYFVLAAIATALTPGLAAGLANPTVPPGIALLTMLPTVGVAWLILAANRMGRRDTG